MFSSTIDIDGLKKQMDQVRPSLQPDLGSAFNKLKGMMEKKKNDKGFLMKMKDKLKKLKEATKFHAGGEVIFTKDSEAPGYEADLKRAGVKYTKEKVS
jgi:hypothetical protein